MALPCCLILTSLTAVIAPGHFKVMPLSRPAPKVRLAKPAAIKIEAISSIESSGE